MSYIFKKHSKDMITCLLVSLFLFIPLTGSVPMNPFDFFLRKTLPVIILFITSFLLFTNLTKRDIFPTQSNIFLALFFTSFSIIGYTYSSIYCFSFHFQILPRMLLKALATFILLCRLLALIDYLLIKINQHPDRKVNENILLGKHAFRNTTLFLLVLWTPIIILSYPGNLCGDTLMQIWEALGTREYWAHNPLLITLALKLFLSLGNAVFGNVSIGFFIFSIAQCIVLAMVLGYSLQRLYERGVSPLARRIVFWVYVLTPTYSNMATTPGKDTLYMALFLLYILFVEQIVFDYNKNKRTPLPEHSLTAFFWLKFILITILLCLVRKNGVYVILPTGICLAFALIPKKNYKQLILLILLSCIIPYIGFSVTQNTMKTITNAEEGSIREMLSIPFQQTARYLHTYAGEISDFERESINKVLLDVNLAGSVYTPDISDPVKGLYNTDATTKDLANYFIAWFQGFLKHPLVYMDAFFQHVYGWFYPGVVNVIRYHAVDEVISAPSFFENTRELLKTFYEKLGYIPPFSLFDNIGAYVWILFWLFFQKINHTKVKWLLFPLFISLLICIASPAFYLHPRYAYPILISIPFVTSIILKEQYVP